MFPSAADLAFARFQRHGDPRSLAIVFDRTAPELLRVARHVAVSATDAEDLVQATFVTAIEAAADWQRGRAVLPWLCGILANHARAARRRHRRTPDPARLRDDVDDPLRAAEDADTRSELLAAIDRLSEMYRPVLRLQFEHGLEAHEIAAALERPAGTVRAQLSRGLEQLRRLLPRGLASSVAALPAVGRGLPAVRGAVLRRCTGTSTGFASALSLGGLLVMQHKLAAVVAAAAFAAFGVWFGMDAPKEAAGATAGADGVAAVTAPARSEQAPAAAAAAEQRTALATDAPRPVTEAPAAEAAPAASGTLVVRIASARGLPLADVGVGVRSMRTPSLQNAAEFVRTDRDGTAVFAGLAPGSWMIDIDRANPEGAEVKAGETAERSVRLPDGITVDGEVVDTDDRPVAGARVLLVGSRTAAPTVAVASADGRFRVEHLAAGLELQAAAAGHAPSLAEPVAGKDGERRSVRLRLLAGGGRVVGRVLDVDGAPCAGASVALLPAGASIPPARDSGHRAQWLHCDRDGRFACDEVGPGGCTVAAWPADGSSPPSWQRVGAARGELRGEQYVELRLQRGAEVHGRVTKDGEPMADAMLVAWFGDGAAEVGYLANLLCFRQTSSDSNGDYRLTGLRPGAVLLRAMGPRASAAEQRAQLALGERLEWNVEVGTAQGLRITLHPATAGGEFALWAFVRAPDAPDSEAPGMVLLHDSGSEVWPGKRTGPVDVVIARVHGTDLVQIAARRGVAAREREVVFDLQPAELPTRTIRGRLVDAQLEPRLGVAVTAVREDGNGLVVRCTASTGADGAFALGPLPAGSYRLTAGAPDAPRALATATATVVDRDEDLGPVKVAP